MVEPLTVDELLAEADAWLALLKAKVSEISKAEIEVKRKNRVIAQAEEIKDSVSDAKQALEGAKDTVATPGAAKEASEAVREAQKAVEEVANTVEKAAGEAATDAPTKQDAKLDAALETAAEAARDARKGAQKATNEVQDSVQQVGQGKQGQGVQKGTEAVAAIAQTQDALDEVSGGVKEAVRIAGQDGRPDPRANPSWIRSRRLPKRWPSPSPRKSPRYWTSRPHCARSGRASSTA